MITFVTNIGLKVVLKPMMTTQLSPHALIALVCLCKWEI